MASQILTVEDVFEVKGRGLVLIPGILPEGSEVFRAGDLIELRRPDGIRVASRIGALELLLGANPQRSIVIVLTGLTKGDVPIGTEVWSVG